MIVEKSPEIIQELTRANEEIEGLNKGLNVIKKETSPQWLEQATSVIGSVRESLESAKIRSASTTDLKDPKVNKSIEMLLQRLAFLRSSLENKTTQEKVGGVLASLISEIKKLEKQLNKDDFRLGHKVKASEASSKS